MLVLSRRRNESVVLDGTITVTVLEIRGNRVRLGINCPDSVRVQRGEFTDAEHAARCRADAARENTLPRILTLDVAAELEDAAA